MTTMEPRPLPPLVRLVEVKKRFGATWILHGISLDVAAGEVVVLVGPSGSGKTTLIRCINALETIDGGRIFVSDGLVGYRESDGGLIAEPERVIARQRAKIGMVFQRFNLFPHMSALDNVMVGPLRVLRRRVQDVRPEAVDLLDKVGLGDKLGAYPGQLSGGQQQRVAIARALAMKPEILLFDEPTSALDPETVGEVLDVMKTVARGGMTMIVVTHEMGFAREVADRVVMMDAGRIVEAASAEQFFTQPVHERTQQFIRGIMNGGQIRQL